MKTWDILKYIRRFTTLTAISTAVSLFAFQGSVAAYASVQDYNDPFLDGQWALHNTGKYTYYSNNYNYTEAGTKDVDINLFEGWDVYPLKKDSTDEVIVALIDTGVDITHVDLAQNIWVNKKEIPANGIDDDKNGYVDDVNGWDFYNGDGTVFHDQTYTDHRNSWGEEDHGTHIAGVIAAAAGNGKGIVGVASNVNVKIMVLKVNGGMKSEGSAANAVKAIKYAEAMGAKVVNMSWGTYSFDHSLYDAMSRSSMLFVCAAGNDGSDNDSNPMYPASYDLDNVLSVTYIDSQGRFDLSKVTNGGGNYGLKTVDIAAPGKDILSTVSGGYAYKSGTSMAAPFVTGVAALCYAFDKSFDALTVKRLILSNTKSLSSLSGKIAVPGIPDVYALAKALSTRVSDETAPRIELSQKIETGKTTVTVSAFDDGTGVKLIKYAPSTVNRDFFENDGTVIENGEALKLTDGYYTFYAEDYVGNTVIKSVFVGEDRMNPVLKAAFSTTDDYKSYVIDISASDAESGIKVVRYMSGNVQRDKIKADGKELKLSDGSASFTADIKTDTVTVYAEDNYGNGTVEVVRLRFQKAAGLMLSMTEGHISRNGSYELKAFVLSAGSTDKIRFESSDPKIASVSADGVIKGAAKGKCTITVTTQSGITATCVIHVD